MTEILHDAADATGGARRLAKKATSNGWLCRLDTVTQRSWKGSLHDCTLLRVERGEEQGVGIWWDGKADVAYVWLREPGRAEIFADRISISDFGRVLSAAPGSVRA